MPAMVSHTHFALRVFAKLKKAGITVADRDTAMIGAQGPDIFFFHRKFPWMRGDSLAAIGSCLHRHSPARLFEGFRHVLDEHEGDPERAAMLGYVEGFFCHYALDRAAHPYILWAQQTLQREQPAYGIKPNQYHYRIESALDTMVLRRDTGRLISQLSLPELMPADNGTAYRAVGTLYADLLDHLMGKKLSTAVLAQPAADMRQALYFMNDRYLVRRKALRTVESLWGKGAFATSLLRPADTADWDYANQAHAQWENPFDPRYTSSQSFFDLYDEAVDEAVDMIAAFLAALSDGGSMQDITQDRGFSSDLPGIYSEVPLPLSPAGTLQLRVHSQKPKGIKP